LTTGSGLCPNHFVGQREQKYGNCKDTNDRENKFGCLVLLLHGGDNQFESLRVSCELKTGGGTTDDPVIEGKGEIAGAALHIGRVVDCQNEFS